MSDLASLLEKVRSANGAAAMRAALESALSHTEQGETKP